MAGKLIIAFMLATAGIAGHAAYAQERSAARAGFSAENLTGQKILLFRPTVWVGAQATGGTPEPNADWTATARELLLAELRNRQSEFTNEVVTEPDLTGVAAETVAAHKALFGAVANSVMVYQFFPGNRLPTRKNKAFEWTLGKDIRQIADLTGARYGLFITTNDQYGSLGRKMFQFLAAGLAGVSVQSGVHAGYAGLVDMETGDLVWLNADGAMGGDVRDAVGMQKRVGQLLEGFPGLKPGVKVAAAP